MVVVVAVVVVAVEDDGRCDQEAMCGNSPEAIKNT